MTARRRCAQLLAVLLLPAFAGCFVGRARGTATPPKTPPPAAAAPAANPDSVAARADSTKMQDSLKVAADSAKKEPVKVVSAKDSAAQAKAAADAKKPRKAPAAKQCVLDFSESPPETRLTYQRIDSTNATTFIGGGLVGRCQGENNRIRADSAEHFQLAGILNLFGNVTYEEPGKMRIQSTHATYFTREERLFADGGVIATQTGSGSMFTGPSIEYFRPMVGVRTESKLVAPNNPTATIIEKDSTGKPGVPVRLNAATMIDIGDSLLYGIGSVVITRQGLTGRSDSAAFNKTTEVARLIRKASIVNNDSAKKFTMNGDTIDLFSKDRKLERVLALHNATAINSDVTLQAERIDLRLVAQKLSEAFAYGGRSKAHTPQQDVVADSLHIVMPDQRVSELRAIGTAVATGIPDTLKIKSEDRDLLRGDTVIARFDSAKFKGDTSQPAIRQIEALGNASSLFQVASRQGPTFPPALNYSRGKNILVQFDSGQIRDVSIDSTASGVYLEPAADSLSDTTKRRGTRRPPAGSGRASRPPSQRLSQASASVPVRPFPTPRPLVAPEPATVLSSVPRRRS